jgi:hypothetical protein
VAATALAGLVLLPVAAPAQEESTPVVNVLPPAVEGKPVFATTLVATPGEWVTDEPDEALTYTYRWLRDGEPVRGEREQTYELDLDDLRSRLQVEVSATDPDGESAAAVSEPTGRVVRAPMVLRGKPKVRGVQRFTRTLTATPGRWRTDPTKVRYQWLRDGEPVKGAREASYRIQPGDVGHRLRVEVTATAPGHERATARSVRTDPVRHRVDVQRTVTYSVATRGPVTASVKEFARLAQQTYDDPRGWRGGGVSFRRVASGGSFTLVLATAEQVPSFSSVCSSTWSCRVGRYVIINQTRWRSASPAWNAGKRSLRDYRHMVVNHETGHWLGLGHPSCPGAGKLAPVMMQQSKGTSGCRFNPFPLLSEQGRV